MRSEKDLTCPDCGVVPGKLHEESCDIERCASCGGQYMSCGCDRVPDHKRYIWTGSLNDAYTQSFYIY